jgi:hypothetical protein
MKDLIKKILKEEFNPTPIKRGSFLGKTYTYT